MAAAEDRLSPSEGPMLASLKAVPMPFLLSVYAACLDPGGILSLMPLV